MAAGRTTIVSLGPAEQIGASAISGQKHQIPRLKVVAHRKTGQLVKGFAELDVSVNAEGVPDVGPIPLPKTLSIHSSIGGRGVNVSTESLKALFFVKSFDGDPAYAETKFFNPAPKIEGLWVHLTFSDGETTEGIVSNNIAFVNESGFLMKPPDPHSNNQAVYVLKSALARFRVVGVRAEY